MRSQEVITEPRPTRTVSTCQYPGQETDDELPSHFSQGGVPDKSRGTRKEGTVDGREAPEVSARRIVKCRGTVPEVR